MVGFIVHLPDMPFTFSFPSDSSPVPRSTGKAAVPTDKSGGEQWGQKDTRRVTEATDRGTGKRDKSKLGEQVGDRDDR